MLKILSLLTAISLYSVQALAVTTVTKVATTGSLVLDTGDGVGIKGPPIVGVTPGGVFVPIKVDSNGNLTVSSSISGTSFADQGAASIISNAWPMKITDETNVALVTAAGALKVDGSAVVHPVSQSGVWSCDQSGLWTVAVSSSALPVGAATESSLVIANSSLASIDSKASTLITQTDGVEGSLSSIDAKVSTTAKQDVGNASLASIDSKASTLISQTDGLEASASSIDTKVSTAAKQDTGNASLASLDTKLSTLLTQTDGIETSLDTLNNFKKASAATLSSVSASASSVSLLSSNAARKGLYLYNDSNAQAYVAFTASAATTSAFSIKLYPNQFYSMDLPIYTGAITCIWSSANGAMRITEF